MYGKNKFSQCFIAKEARFGQALMFFLVVLMSTLTLLYCMIVPCIILARINLDTAFTHLKHYMKRHHPGYKAQFSLQLRRLVISSMLYPLAFFLSMVGSVVYVYSMFIVESPPTGLFVFAVATRCFTGLFNLIAFSADPSVQRALAATCHTFESSYSRTSSIPTQKCPGESTAVESDPMVHDIYSILDHSPVEDDFQSYLKAT